MNIILSILFAFTLLFGGKPLKEERILAYIEIVQIDGGIYVRTTYDSRVFDNECSPKHVVAREFMKNCVLPDSTKTKKL